MRITLAGGLLLIALFAGPLACTRSDPPAAPKAPDPYEESLAAFPLPAAGEAALLNVSSKATYVGIRACVECHADEYESYRQTPHSRALDDIHLEAEPPDAEFEHAPTRRVYRTYRESGQLRHRESLKAADGEQIVLGDYPVRYVIGSGNHSRSYLIDIDGFLVESPLTWYTSRQQWALSPGYDKINFGFSRPASTQCVNCHAGRVGSVDGSLHRLELHEYAIGCERCHGPGSLHVERWSSGAEGSGDADPTIVHPGRLTREQDESICYQCHLRTAASILVRGRGLGDFRPGLPLHLFQTSYGLEIPNQEMKVAGHAEQMRLSRCYQDSETLRCTTCHDPHGGAAHQIGPDHYRQRCLSCHQTEESCSLPRPDRLARTAEDNCVACHMPQVPIDIPHFAFTHHRIGIHDQPQTSPNVAEQDRPGSLVPLDDLSDLPAIDRDRNLGLAYVEMASEAALDNHPLAFRAYCAQARKILEDVERQGLRDPEVTVAMAGLVAEHDRLRSVQLVQEALQHSGQLTPDTRMNALLMLGSAFFQSQQNQRAIEVFDQLVQLRRDAEDWIMLGICHHRERRIAEAVAALQKAAEINPSRPDVHEILAELYRVTGQNELQQFHLQRARLFSAY